MFTLALYDDAQSYRRYFRVHVTGIMQRRDHYPSSPWRASVYAAWNRRFSCWITFQVHGYYPAPWESGNWPQQEQVHISSPTGWVCQPLRLSHSTSEEQVTVFNLNSLIILPTSLQLVSGCWCEWQCSLSAVCETLLRTLFQLVFATYHFTTACWFK